MPPEDVAEMRRAATRALFAASVLFAPVPFSMLFIVGLFPLAATILFFVRVIAVGGSERFLAFVTILGAHLVIDGGILYLFAMLTCRLLFWLLPPPRAARATRVMLTAGAVAPFLPIYILAGRGDYEWMTVWELLRFVGRWG